MNEAVLKVSASPISVQDVIAETVSVYFTNAAVCKVVMKKPTERSGQIVLVDHTPNLLWCLKRKLYTLNGN